MSTDPWEADLTLAEIRAARLRNRRRIGTSVAPLLALAALLACSAGWALVFGRHRIAMFYAPGLVVVAAFCGLRTRRDAATRGVQVKVWPWIVTAVVLLVLSASVSRWATANHHRTIEEIGPALVFALGVVGFGFWTRTSPVVAAGASMIAISALSPLIASGDACVAVQFSAYAVVLAITARANSGAH